MSVAFIVDLPGATQDDYDWVLERLELQGRMPPGGLFHAAGAIDGAWRVCDVWETAEAFARFADDRLGPLVGQRLAGAPRMTRIDAFGEVAAGEATPALVQVVRFPALMAEELRERNARTLPDGVAPEGCLLHVDGACEGGYAVMDAWSSEALLDRFVDARAVPVSGEGAFTMQRMAVARTLAPAAPVAA